MAHRHSPWTVQIDPIRLPAGLPDRLPPAPLTLEGLSKVRVELMVAGASRREFEGRRVRRGSSASDPAARFRPPRSSRALEVFGGMEFWNL